jgi:Cu/Ag efflux pump CusA
MLRRVVDFSLDNRWIVLSLAVAVIAFGLYTMWNIPIEAFTTGLPGGRKIHRLNPGSSENALRLLPLMASLAALLLFAQLARRVYGDVSHGALNYAA